MFSITEHKASLRAESLARRDTLDADARRAASSRIAERAAAMVLAKGEEPVSAYWPIRSEVDPRPAMKILAKAGFSLCLPVVTKAGLVFREWRFGAPLVRMGFGLSVPAPDAPELQPKTMLVPLAAFDRHANRIGYGKGYYDGAIARLAANGPLFLVGLAFAAQEVDAVPVEEHDRRLDAIVTDSGVIGPDLAPDLAIAGGIG